MERLGPDDDEGVVDGIRDHLRTDHPELVARVSDDDIRSWIEVVD